MERELDPGDVCLRIFLVSSPTRTDFELWEVEKGHEIMLVSDLGDIAHLPSIMIPYLSSKSNNKNYNLISVLYIFVNT